ncbi:cytochrome c [Seonamhaeicola sediminis]|uniref:Cytochrome c n=1 Tax=Seonamhaeicola sediminis TaxID=2528206 RepID=A0A562YCB8_9FLAO|nr:c-type cytochrome [Seonamhaeicola sediminis]TWO32097.1 cytochrome c [Seonamhaeicola sediminis]
MKKILKILGIGIAAILGLIAIFLLYIGLTDIPSYKVEQIDFHAKSTPQALERGKKLTMMLCANCHMNSETRKLTGKRMLDAPPEFGKIYSQNITQDKEYGIGNWTDGEIVYLLRTGIKKNGQYSPPYMAKLPKMADEDINAIIAFLRSDDPMVVSSAIPDTPTKPSFLTKLLCRVAFKPFSMPNKTIEMPDPNNDIELGKYLAHNLDCFSCHSADFKTNNYMDPSLSEGYFGGGNKPLNEEGRVMLTQNLTPDKETGIGTWTKEDFINTVKYGIKKGENAMRYPMAPYTQLTDKEAGAIFEYLQTIPAISNKVERSFYN